MSVHPISSYESSERGYCAPESDDCYVVGHKSVTGSLSNVLDEYVIFPVVLGEGQFGCVRECLHRKTGKAYACKSIDKSRATGGLEKLKHEVDVLSEIDHRGIVKLVGCYEDADYIHIVTEKCTGGDLFDEIARHKTSSGCYSEHRAAGIVKSLLGAVAYLHERDLVHRDLKPDNILLSEGRDIKLIDFGLSRRHRKGEAPMSDPVGTAYFMAPELLKGKYDKSCDMWSLGTIVYVLLAGFPPFNGETDHDIYQSILDGHIEFYPEQWASKSDEAKDLIKRLLHQDPRERLTAEEALRHPWIVNLGKRKNAKRQSAGRRNDRPISYLRIP